MEHLDKLKGYVDVYKINSLVDKVKNAVYNYTEFEIKVRSATNAEPWGASSTLMQEIAQGTNQYAHFNEIMDTIYARLAEKNSVTGSDWRHVYKALQLIDYLIKNGAERVIDSVREHSYELKSLSSFHHIDEKGKDQGINVRHRAKEIADLLKDTDRIKAERRKAKENRQKYTGVASNSFSTGSGGGGGSRYGGGFGSDSGGYAGNSGGGGYGGSSYSSGGGGGGGYGGSTSGSGFRDDEGHGGGGSGSDNRSRARPAPAVASVPAPAPVVTPAPKPVVADLLDIGSDWGASATAAPATSIQQASAAKAPAATGFDDFADFQSAPAVAAAAPAFAAFSSPAPPATNNVSTAFGGFADFASAPAPRPATQQPSYDLLGGGGGAGGAGGFTPNYSVSSSQSAGRTQSSSAFPAFQQTNQFGGAPLAPQQQQQQPKKADAFSALVSLDAGALSGGGRREEATGPSLASMGQAFNPYANQGSMAQQQQQQQPAGAWGQQQQGFAQFGAFGGQSQQQHQPQQTKQQPESLF
ncbi:Epsin-3, clathrin recruitment and traffic between the Golgi and endosome [Thoreauomyces humboldtii]|nr:Epsin-3, clathrin recruitment and traffic between the Golgi and endosome [Thoreauomyces humboldtii]